LSAQEAFPLYQASLSPSGETIPEPFSTTPVIITNPWREIPSSTSPAGVIESMPFDPAISQAFNLGLLHAITGLGTAYMGKTTGRILAKYYIEQPEESPFLFQTIMLSTAVAMGQWLNEMVQAAIIEQPTTPKDEVHFYNRMSALGTRIFSTIDKTISTLPLILAPVIVGGVTKKDSNIALLAAAETLVATYQLYNYFSPTAPVILTKTDLKDQIIAALESKNYAFAYQFVKNSPIFTKELAADPVLKNDIENALYQAENDLIEASSKMPQTGPSLSTQFKYLADLWYELEHSLA
jgi:F0F1-type ATP synthase membrane subunit c/vacuolar-type H+-ATPase subunit K